MRLKINLFLGRLEPLKNYENILKAFKKVKDNGVEFKYIIFGQGFLEEKLKYIISKYNLENNVLLIGGVRGAKSICICLIIFYSALFMRFSK